MRLLFLLLMIALSCVRLGIAIADTETDRERDGFIGPVHKVVVEKRSLSELDIIRHDAAVLEAQKVRWVQRAAAAEHDNRRLSRIIVYNANGNRTEAVHYTKRGHPRWRWHYAYNVQGQRIARNSYASNGTLRSMRRYTYDTRGQLKTQCEYNAAGELERVSQYHYDNRGHMIDEIHSRADGRQVWHWRYAYDAIGRQIEKRQYDGQDQLVYRWQYVYDERERGNLQEKAKYDASGGLIQKQRYRYNARGDVVERQDNATGNLQPEKWHYTYTYDAMGNWVKRTLSRWMPADDIASSIPLDITYRTFTYQ